MQRVIPWLGLSVPFLAASVAAWWSLRDTGLPPSPTPPWTGDMQAVANGNNQFSFDLYRKLREESGNLFLSPYSAHTALAMTATGSRGITRDQMLKVLHLAADGSNTLAAGDLGRNYAHPRKDYELAVANALWGQKGFPWRPEFLDAQKSRFGAGFREADFAADPDGERKRINRWVEEQTRDRIKDLIGERMIKPLQRMVLVNAIYFKGAWQEQFDPRRTHPAPFTLADGTTTSVPTMYRKGKLNLYTESVSDTSRDIAFQVGELPYRGGDLSMVVLLPGKHDGLPALEAKLSADTLAGWLAKMHDAKEIDISLPKFRIETGAMRLEKPLQKLGMVVAFDPDAADFTGLHSGQEQLYLNFVVQKAFVDVNEEGTVAAAATAVGVKATSARIELDFRVNRPFLFLIRDVRHGTILFVGRVQKP